MKIIKNKGILFWITGLPGSGKTSIAKLLKKDIEKKIGPTLILSGDDVRKMFNLNSYSHNDRKKYVYNKKSEILPTGSCLILITPDSERTMCTFLGIAGKINDQDINDADIKNSDMIFLEGYLWDEGEPKKAFNKAIESSKRQQCRYQTYFALKDTKRIF